MFTSSIPQLFSEETEGDGNCAFNAFILGLSRQSVIDRLDAGFIQSGEDPNISMKDFIQKTSKILNIRSTWIEVKERLLQLRTLNKIQLQKQLAPVLRQLAVKLAEDDYQFIERTTEPLLSAYNDFYTKQTYSGDQERKPKGTEDDIFKYHSFIQQKFDELLRSHREPSAAISELEHWWKSQHSEQSGYRKFLQEMKKDGVWAGDLELFQLARYFHINLDVLRENFVHRIYMNSGKIPKKQLHSDLIRQLVARQVIDVPQSSDNHLYFLPINEKEVQERLQAIPEFDQVAWYILENPYLKGTLVPSEWSKCLHELNLRNVISKESGQYKFIINQDEAMERIAQISSYEKVVQTWQTFHYEAPTVMLFNPSATHWSNALPKNDFQLRPAVQRIFSIINKEAQFKYICAALVYKLMQQSQSSIGTTPSLSRSFFRFFSNKSAIQTQMIAASPHKEDRATL